MSIHRDRKFCILSDSMSCPNHRTIFCEQHKLIPFDLLFKTPADSLVLVDEPDISHHVGWQSCFLDDLIVLPVRSPDLPGAHPRSAQPIIPSLGTLTCLYLMYSLPSGAWRRLALSLSPSPEANKAYSRLIRDDT